MTRRQLTDKQEQLIEPFLPMGEHGPNPEQLREQFEGVIWRFRTSSQWWEMPGRFGPWPTVYREAGTGNRAAATAQAPAPAQEGVRVRASSAVTASATASLTCASVGVGRPSSAAS